MLMRLLPESSHSLRALANQVRLLVILGGWRRESVHWLCVVDRTVALVVYQFLLQGKNALGYLKWLALWMNTCKCYDACIFGNFL